MREGILSHMEGGQRQGVVGREQILLVCRYVEREFEAVACVLFRKRDVDWQDTTFSG